MEEINKKSTADIIQEMTYLDQEIGLMMLRYNKLAKEITARFPQVKNDEVFKPKVFCKQYEGRK